MSDIDRERIRTQIAASVMPQTLEIALKGYGHVCDVVTERACRNAYEVADAFLKHSAALAKQ